MDRFHEIARICHAVNRAYCHELGDDSQPEWEQAPEWQRQSAVNSVHAVLQNLAITPAELHANWMAEKIAAGWTYGTVKDAEQKTHPCLVAYDALPKEQRIKDALFRTIVAALDSRVIYQP